MEQGEVGELALGRAAETGLLSDALDTASRCSGRAVFFVGDAGIGKSRLAGECAYRAYERGMRPASAPTGRTSGAC
ncbi:ATP-binding protein, partial [Streptomyces sp. sk2.1]|uniref:ATP-binding protein n=1 Tax=Streptomyces sp. sk2.1 TaxID=2478959 RepID=UPI0011E633EC